MIPEKTQQDTKQKPTGPPKGPEAQPATLTFPAKQKPDTGLVDTGKAKPRVIRIAPIAPIDLCPSTVRAYMAAIGRRGGKAGKRILSREDAQEMARRSAEVRKTKAEKTQQEKTEQNRPA